MIQSGVINNIPRIHLQGYIRVVTAVILGIIGVNERQSDICRHPPFTSACRFYMYYLKSVQ